jgi:hypothetical protein
MFVLRRYDGEGKAGGTMDDLIELEYERVYYTFPDRYDLRNWLDEADKERWRRFPAGPAVG